MVGLLWAFLCGLVVITAWALSLIATLFRRRAIWLLVLETPLFLYATWYVLALMWFG
jgi:hypothetical protein